MKNYWVSWYHDPDTVFELHAPWWVLGERLEDGVMAVYAALHAEDEEAAHRLVAEAYERVAGPLQRRFCDERPDDWSPFSDRFPRKDWMEWPPEKPAMQDYRQFTNVAQPYATPPILRPISQEALRFLWGQPWDGVAFQYLATLRPSAVRVLRLNEELRGMPEDWRRRAGTVCSSTRGRTARSSSGTR